MNFLAHAFLSCSDEDLLIGNLITDLIKKRDEVFYNPSIKKGIDLHRQIDQYTDQHPETLALRQLLRKRHDKYASVVVDLVWDYFLCKNWNQFKGQSLELFAQEIYDVLYKKLDYIQPHLKDRIRTMIEDDFLLAYSNLDRAQRSLAWMDRRVKHPSKFAEAIKDIQENEDQIELWFQKFMPDLIEFVDGTCGC